MLAITWQGIIATPFGYVMDCIYHLVKHYGLAIILFAAIVQVVLVLIQQISKPLDAKAKANAAKAQALQPIIDQIRKDHADDLEQQNKEIIELYDNEKISLMGNFLLSVLSGLLRFIIPLLILVPIFQVMAQPITYLFHETPETSQAIIEVMQEEAPELFNNAYKQVTAINHIQDYADIIKERVPEVSEKTLQGLNYRFLGIDMSVVLGSHILGKGTWAWDWAHIGALLLPLLYIGRRMYRIFSGMIRSLIDYGKKKKRAKKLCLTPPKMPKPPLLDLFFLFLSVTAMATIPVAMDLYWLVGGVTASMLAKMLTKWRENRITAKAIKDNNCCG